MTSGSPRSPQDSMPAPLIENSFRRTQMMLKRYESQRDTSKPKKIYEQIIQITQDYNVNFKIHKYTQEKETRMAQD